MWDDGQDMEPERSEEELRHLVGAKAARIRMRRRLQLTGATAAVLALLVGVVAVAQDDGRGRRDLRVASDAGGTSTSTVVDGAAALDEPEATTSTTSEAGPTPAGTRRGTTATTVTTAPVRTPSTLAGACGKATSPQGGAVTGEAVQGVWVLCGPSPFGTDEIGLEVGADGRWSKLTRAADGGLLRSRRWGEMGGWRHVGDDQVNFKIEGSGTMIAGLRFSDDRSLMQFDHTGGNGSYARVSAGSTVSDPPPSTGAECTREEGRQRTMASADEFSAAAAQVWLLCAAPSFVGTTSAGLEIRPDGRWAELDRRADGALVRSTDPARSGTWETVDTSVMNGPGSYAFSWELASGGANTAELAFASATTKMRILGYRVTDYVRAPAGAAVVG